MANPAPGDDPGRAARVADLANMDRIGPRTRAVIAESPVDMWVGRLIADAPMWCFNPETMAIDDVAMARWLEGKIREKMSGSKTRYSPLVPSGSSAQRRRR